MFSRVEALLAWDEREDKWIHGCSREALKNANPVPTLGEVLFPNFY